MSSDAPDHVVRRIPMRLRDVPERLNAISGELLDAGIEVHRTLGTWYNEAMYRDCLAYELRLRGHSVEVEYPLPLRYKGLVIPNAFFVDLLVDDSVVVELKTVPALEAAREAQLVSYLYARWCQLGILLNFHAPLLKEGFRRRALSAPTS